MCITAACSAMSCKRFASAFFAARAPAFWASRSAFFLSAMSATCISEKNAEGPDSFVHHYSCSHMLGHIMMQTTHARAQARTQTHTHTHTHTHTSGVGTNGSRRQQNNASTSMYACACTLARYCADDGFTFTLHVQIVRMCARALVFDGE